MKKRILSSDSNDRFDVSAMNRLNGLWSMPVSLQVR